MTPAERASAVAFAIQNCALEALVPDESGMRASSQYAHGSIGIDEVLDATRSGACTPGDLVFANTVALAERGWRASGELGELMEIHRFLFDRVYPGAGRLRTRDVARSDTAAPSRASDPEAFFPAALIETGAMNISGELAEKHNLRSLDRAVFVHELAKIYDELGYLHPFDRGNAMTLRIFASRISHDAGWDLDWATVTRGEYEKAKHDAYGGDISGFEHLFSRAQRPANPTRIFLIAGWDQGPAH
ncbi:MAG: Fic family protein [Bifidobacterium sp.]|jgi:cell filamentation protein|nr:Fic family protein [Bifidobacterium sp.]MCI1864387.1 Fic family protein [Bifidobacterium sp.]